MAKSLNVVHEAVEKASKVSPRPGKWATPKEIDIKTTPKQSSIQSILSELVRDSRIEKKSGMLLYRPQQGAGPGGQGEGGKDRGGKDRWKPRRPPNGKKPGRRDDGKKPDGGKKPGRRGDGKKPSDDAAERERQRKRDYMKKQQKEYKAHKKFVHPKDRKSNLGRTVACGVGTQIVSQGIGGGIARSTASTITKSILM